jgi:hypothetical protein
LSSDHARCSDTISLAKNDEGQVDELFAVMWINLQQQTESELSRVGKRRDGQHNPVSASV